jgi:hypothetical protein
MRYSISNLMWEAQEALRRLWFIRSVEEREVTANTISLRLYIRPDLFVEAFVSEWSGSIYFALIEGAQRIFGIDWIDGEWHIHPYERPDQHQPLPEGLGPRPLLQFLARVEDLILQNELL